MMIYTALEEERWINGGKRHSKEMRKEEGMNRLPGDYTMNKYAFPFNEHNQKYRQMLHNANITYIASNIIIYKNNFYKNC
jgi:hypothetical protein